MEEYIAKVETMRKAHQLLVANQDLVLEVAPRDSRFSPVLLEMMRKEELLMKDPSSNAARALVQKVDEALRTETQQFFAKVVNQNSRKWEMLRGNMRKEIAALKRYLASRLSSEAVQEEPLDIIAAEEERLQIDYNRNWHRYEVFHLQEAFKSQTARIDRDWNTHEESLKNDFDTKKAAIVGPAATTAGKAKTGSDNNEDLKWQHPEKQKTLIHTAPVFTPARASTSSTTAATTTNNAAANSKNVAELQRLERDYQDALTSLLKQKTDAKKWLYRQQVRLTAQCEEVRKEKSLVADVLQEEYSELTALQKMLVAAKQLQQQQEQQQQTEAK